MLIKVLRWIMIGLAVALLQISVIPYLELWGNVPDLFMIYSLIILVRFGKIPSMFAAFISGVLIDMFSSSITGVTSFSRCTVVFWLGTILENKSISVKLLRWTILLFVASFFQETTSSLVRYLAYDINIFEYMMSFVLPTAIYTTCVGFIYFMLMGIERTSLRGPGSPKLKRT